MSCHQCCGIEDIFDEKLARKELRRYRKKGPTKTTGVLINQLEARMNGSRTLLDIGGGIGAIQHALLANGIDRATSVDGSSSYVEVAREEAQVRGLTERISHHHGNFVELAPSIAVSDVVTMDRVICCYDDMEDLMQAAMSKAGRLVGLVYPRNTWTMIFVKIITALYARMRKSSYRMFVHSTERVDSLVRAAGFQQVFYDQTLVWQVVVYERV